MFPFKDRIAIFLISLTVGAVSFYQQSQLLGALIVVGGLILLIGARYHATVWLAFRAARNEDFESVERWLQQIHNPEKLSPQSKAYYFFLKGAVAYHKNQLVDAGAYFSKAAAGGLRSKNDRGLALIYLAAVSLNLGAPDVAENCLNEARSLVTKKSAQELLERVHRRVAIES